MTPMDQRSGLQKMASRPSPATEAKHRPARTASGMPAPTPRPSAIYGGAITVNLLALPRARCPNLAVLDIDAKHAEAHSWWEAHRAQLPQTRTIRTRSGGLHLWYRDAPGLRCSVSMIAPGVDVRATGGYVIAWHAAGLPVLRDGPLPTWPEWLLPVQTMAIRRASEQPRVPDDRQMAALVRFVASAPAKQRNNRLFWAACRMAGMVASRLLTRARPKQCSFTRRCMPVCRRMRPARQRTAA